MSANLSTSTSGTGTTDWKSIIVWLVLSLIWSSTWMAIKIGLAELPPLSFAAIRFVIAAAVLFAVCAIRRIPVWTPRQSDHVFFAITGFLTFTVNYGLLFWGEQKVSSGLGAVLQATIPLFGMLFAHWFLPGEPVRLRGVLGVLLGLAGVGAIFSNVLSVDGPASLYGGLAIVVGAASAAFSNVLFKLRKGGYAPAMVAAWQMFYGAFPLIALGLWREGNPLHFAWNGSAVACLFYLALVGSSLAFLMYYWLMGRIALNKLQSIALVTPPLALVVGWFVAGERFASGTLAGSSLILVGLGLIFYKPSPKSESKAALPVLEKTWVPASETL
jgi:drug/metabolite transporter (DMT)-like permease